jgi:hypothetical protein
LSISYPTSLDTTGVDTGTLPQPSATDLLDSATTALLHTNQHGNANEAIVQLETKVGVTNSQDNTTTSLDVRMRVREYADFTVVPNSFSSGFTDDEFLATSLHTSLWTWLNQNTNSGSGSSPRGGTTLATQVKSHLTLAALVFDSLAVSSIYQAVPSTSSWTIESKVCIISTTGGNGSSAGIVLYESGTSKLITFGKLASNPSNNENTAYDLRLTKWESSGSSSVNGQSGGGGNYTLSPASANQYQHPLAIYIQVAYDGTNYYWSASNDGVAWQLVGTQAIANFFTSKANYIGLYIYNNYGSQTTDTAYATFDYIREVA